MEAMGGLHYSIVDWSTAISDPGYFHLPGHRIAQSLYAYSRCHDQISSSHGTYVNHQVDGNNLDQPLYNRAVQGVYPPGSTIKPMEAMGGLHYSIVNSSHKQIRVKTWARH
jgi:cell division protein FtsI/penicillin-binding protein 2